MEVDFWFLELSALIVPLNPPQITILNLLVIFLPFQQTSWKYPPKITICCYWRPAYLLSETVMQELHITFIPSVQVLCSWDETEVNVWMSTVTWHNSPSVVPVEASTSGVWNSTFLKVMWMDDAYMYRAQCLTSIRHGKKERTKERKKRSVSHMWGWKAQGMSTVLIGESLDHMTNELH